MAVKRSPRTEAVVKADIDFDSLKHKDAESVKVSMLTHLKYSLAKDQYSATKLDVFNGLAMTLRDFLFERWIETQQTYYNKGAKRVYYLSLEFLMGRTLTNTIINLGMHDVISKAVSELGLDLNEIEELEYDAGLGNGGLGRLAACFLDSMATLELPAYGYGIRYEYGIFFQKIIDGYQVETPDPWLRYGNPWEIPRPEFLYPVTFYGHLNEYNDSEGFYHCDWEGGTQVMAMAYDVPIPGYNNNTVNNMRLWAAKSTRDFELDYFNHGNYEQAVSDKVVTETLSKVLYPNDNVFEGKELRLKQEYFFVSATLQDIIRRYKKTHGSNFSHFSDKVAVQLNDTHPAIGIAELMRILLDVENLSWEESWDITVNTFGYTNHTILPEALEKWPMSLFSKVLPRHIKIINEINFRFLNEIERRYPGDISKLSRMSIIEEGNEKRVRMANLAIIGSHSVNGVSQLHSDIIRDDIFSDFHLMYPGKFNNKTNGITQRRWLAVCNPMLAGLITESIGGGWIRDLYKLKKLIPLAKDKSFLSRWEKVKTANKKVLADYIYRHNCIEVDPESIFDCQVKRLHEYKRQLLNILHAVTLYNRIRENPDSVKVKRTIILAGKAAPGYYTAKLIIKLVNAVAETVNNDSSVKGMLKVVFLANYGVSLAEKIIPAANLSEQISTAGTEASGTSNMKFALNGALTIGTLDGANIEILEEVGKDNIFIFGYDSAGLSKIKSMGYDPQYYYNTNDELKKALDMISSGYFSPYNTDLFKPLTDSLIYHGDNYMLLADYQSYIDSQRQVEELYFDRSGWNTKSVLNVAKSGKFSSDRTIEEYAKDIWGAKPVSIKLPE
ncbi:MAG: glycogen/starch/alpha-glucan phosphorylase [Spirochaetales bacterium]|nr:glycogen/starch/alpha-glucan phosphorylase [Spirochaetales bacterium]